MKPTQAPFLFFFLALLLTPYPGTGQEMADSTYLHYNAIIHPQHPADLPSGISFYTRLKDHQLGEADTLAAIESLRMIAIAQYKIGELYDSEASIVEALDLIHHLQARDTLTDAKVGLYNQLGRIYRNLQDYPRALQALDAALQITPKRADSIVILNNKANIYKDQGQYGQALAAYRQVYRKTLAAADSLHLAMALDNIGSVLSTQKDPAALDTLQKALAIREHYNDLSSLYASYKNLALYYAGADELPTALSYAQKALETARKINGSEYRNNALQLLLQLKGDPLATEYIRLTDSTTQANLLAENKYAFAKYNLAEEQKKTAEQELQKEREARSKQLYQLSTALILLLLILTFFILRYRYNKGKQEAVYHTEARISKKVHDELANEVFNVLAYAETNTLLQPVAKEKLLTSLDKLYGKTRDLSRDTAQVPTGPGYPAALKDLLGGFSSDKVNVIIHDLDTLPWPRISALKKMACYRVLQELMVNMKKHSGATLVLLKFEREGNRALISYSDNGQGIAPGASLDLGGLQIAENRMEAIKGTFTFDTQGTRGFRCQLGFPL